MEIEKSMDSSLEFILKKQQNHYRILKAIYDAGSNEYTPINIDRLGRKIGFTQQEIDDAELYLLGQGLIDRFTDQGSIRLTHRGTVEVENSVLHPDKPTEHFSIQVIQNFYSTVGAVQTGSSNTANSNQSVETIPTKSLGGYQSEQCAWCHGSGIMHGSRGETFCGCCKGQGYVEVLQPSKQCPQCNGTGTKTGGYDFNNRKDLCFICGGTGWSLRKK